MKISKLFHWLYFIVMMLPILSIPIFAIYSHRHTIDTYSVQAEENKVVEFNQIIDINTFDGSTNDYWAVYNANASLIDDNIIVLSVNTSNPQLRYSLFDIDELGNHKKIIKFDALISSTDFALSQRLIYHDVANDTYSDTSLTSLSISSSNTWFHFEFLPSVNFNIFGLMFGSNSNGYSFYVKNLQCFDLTKMFGTGNEPSLEQFNIWYPNEYYDYTLSDKQLLKTGNYITYDDTDIGSQFIYDVYNVVDKYFNYDNVFNFSHLYDWLNLTFFNGGASLGFFIFWHLLIYWLLTSILWLIFDVLMYVPMFIHRWLDKASLS